MQNEIRIVKNPPMNNRVNKYRRAYEENILYKEENRLERLKNMVMLEEKREPERRLRKNSRWKFKSCPKCHGDLNSCYGEDFTCFQCGYVVYSWINKVENFKGGFHGKTKES